MSRIIQFGTSRFLQAHVDLFVHQARLEGQRVGPIAVVKTTSGGDRAGRIAALKTRVAFPVRIRGLQGGQVVDETVHVGSVDQAFDAETEWPDVVGYFAHEASIAVSNVGDRGYELSDADATCDYAVAAAPRSFPAKLLALLIARHRVGGKPLLFLPTELVSGNGSRLAEIVSNLAVETGQSNAFQAWLAESVVFADTLVDRIVSEPIEPVGAVAEPYALWAIRKGKFDMPFRHPAVRLVDDLEPIERLKLHILNLGHSVLADIWLQQRRPENESVKTILDELDVRSRLIAIYETEVIPGFGRRNMGIEAARYVAATLERFMNPFLNHRLADIAQNHPAKLGNRIAAFLVWVRRRDPDFATPRLDATLARSSDDGTQQGLAR
jgi:tagaturonate reductase